MVYTAAPADGAPGADAALSRNWAVVLVRGLVAIGFGALTIVQPGLTLVSLLLWFGGYLVVDAIFAIVCGVRAARRRERWGTLILQGIAGLATAALAFAWPGLTLLAVVLLLAAWATVSGVLTIAAALRLRRGGGRGWLMAGGAVSVTWGVLLAMSPLAGALVLAIWLGAYAMAFGAALLPLAWRLRRERSRLHDDDAPAELAPDGVS